MGARVEHIGLDGRVVVTDRRTLPEAQAEAVERLRGEFDAQVAKGAIYSGKPIQIDDASQMRMAAVVTQITAGVPLPAGFAWRCADNSYLPVNTNQMVGLAAAAAARVMALRVALWAAVDAARAAKTREEADAVKAAWL